VRDIAHEETDAQAADVEAVLASLDISEARREEIIEVWNKADLLDEERLDVAREAAARADKDVIIVSAVTGFGIEALLAAVEERLSRAQSTVEVTLEPADGEGLAWLYARTEVTERETLDDGRTRLTVRADPARLETLKTRFPNQIRA
jgi:GTP-binding protein HflX